MNDARNRQIFADFNNADQKGRLRLNTNGTEDDLRLLGLQLYDGLQVVLDDREELQVDGTVRYCEVEGWVAEIDWAAIRNRTSSQ